MTLLELVLSGILWVMIGLWISFKRNWYFFLIDDLEEKEVRNLAIILNIVLMPICITIALLRQFILPTWNNGNNN